MPVWVLVYDRSDTEKISEQRINFSRNDTRTTDNS